MLKFLKRLFSRQENFETFVIFDGDQTSSASFKKVYKESNKVRYAYLTVSTKPKILDSTSVSFFQVNNIGKESTDVEIAMMSMRECCINSNLKELIIVSSDGDMVGVLSTLARQFPNIKFYMIRDPLRGTAKKATSFLKNNSVPNFTMLRLK